jgi:hypothetical protein
MLILPMLLGAFQPPSPHLTGRHILSLEPRTKNLLASCYVRRCSVTINCVSQQILLSGFGGRKAPSSVGKMSTAEVLRLRATNTVSRNQSVRRSAQDDDSVGVSTKNTLNKLMLMGRSTGLAAQDCILGDFQPSPFGKLRAGSA